MSNKIEARTRSLRELLDNQKYKVDYFQREYKWESKQLQQLLLDLEEAFFLNYADGHTIADVVEYNTYFLGPIILIDEGSSKSIVDGQQRLTTLTLLLIHLNKLQSNYEEQETIETLIYSKRHGRKSYNIEVPDRTDVLDALYQGKTIIDIAESEHIAGLFAPLIQKVDKKDESVQNMIDRFNDIESYFSEEIRGEKLLMFIDYLKEKLLFVEIVTFSEENAFTIFETMNDRGLSLTPTEMLKGYLLSNIDTIEFRDRANDLWKKKISQLHQFSVKEDNEFMKAWLRGQYARTQRNRKKGSGNEDFGKIGTHFHTWVRDNSKYLNLDTSDSVFYFIQNDFKFYCDVYQKVLKKTNGKYDGGSVAAISSYYSIATSLSLPLYMAAISKLDSESTVNEKIDLVSKFLDAYAVGRSINEKPIGQSSISYSLFSLIKNIRNCEIVELRKRLSEELYESNALPFDITDLTVTSKNYRFIRYLFCRLVYQVKLDNQTNISFQELISLRKNNRLVPIQILPSNRYEIYSDYFEDEEVYSYYTNLIGNYLLAPAEYFNKVDNLPSEKRINYLKELGGFLPNILPLEFEEFSLTDFNYHFDQVAIHERGNELNKMVSKIWNDNL
ncbi:hypothetical protein LEM8419_00668 [Neolewinella maritima]|uniref:GmrSD restriction endonucleases N-terminal domain-containing protein n=1 Tax=Neolewinella maritima TaxID=1383882 RepID=A0ABM9AYL0_9BACT|nr:DUF262 domain-containing protein [Neolewinella maritima]CAH0999370.1 hypothetical protein LEM8419_00668 [Neolewinella maritima]